MALVALMAQVALMNLVALKKSNTLFGQVSDLTQMSKCLKWPKNQKSKGSILGEQLVAKRLTLVGSTLNHLWTQGAGTL